MSHDNIANTQDSKIDIRGVSGFLRVGGQVVMGGNNVSPLVEIGLTDLPKSGGAIATPAPPSLTPLLFVR